MAQPILYSKTTELVRILLYVMMGTRLEEEFNGVPASSLEQNLGTNKDKNKQNGTCSR